MEKRLKTHYIIAISILAIVTILILSSLPKTSIVQSPEELILPTYPLNCTSAEINTIWSESFTIDTTNTKYANETSHQCDRFIIYKKESPALYTIEGFYNIDKEIVASHFIFDSLYFTDIIDSNLTGNQNTTEIQELLNQISIEKNYAERTLNTVSSAESYLSSNFINLPLSWDSIISTDKFFTFRESEENDSTRKTITIKINQTASESIATYIVNNLAFSCLSNWTLINDTTCHADDTYSFWYNDTKTCQTPTNQPSNESYDCDYNNNSIIGKSTSIKKNNLNTLEIQIEDKTLNDTLNYNGTREVEIIENGVTKVSFDHDFSTVLNLKNIELRKQSSSSNFGYIIIDGITDEKEAYIERIRNSTSVCIRDKKTNSISEFSENCNDSDETLLGCPGNKDGFTCSIISNLIKVKGLEKSAVAEFSGTTPPPPSPICIRNWSCSSFGTCLNRQQSRTCTDINACNVTTGRPSLTQTCSPACTSNWNCNNFTSECPNSGIRNRTCIDINNCGTSTGRPSLTETCEESPNNKRTTALIFIVIIGIIILFLIALLIHFILKKNTKEKQSNISFNLKQE
jgi:hypothetical protein